MTYANFGHAQRVARILDNYPDYRSLSPEQRGKLLAIALRGAFTITAASIADAIAANDLRETHD